MGIDEFLQAIYTKIYGPDRTVCKIKKKNVEFICSEEQQNAFDRLKVIMAKEPVVKVFDPKKDITLTTDSISGILS